jgi:hypothetical protein
LQKCIPNRSWQGHHYHVSSLSPWANYIESNSLLSAKFVPTFADRGCHMVSVTDPYGRNIGFLEYIYFNTVNLFHVQHGRIMNWWYLHYILFQVKLNVMPCHPRKFHPLSSHYFIVSHCLEWAQFQIKEWEEQPSEDAQIWNVASETQAVWLFTWIWVVPVNINAAPPPNSPYLLHCDKVFWCHTLCWCP